MKGKVIEMKESNIILYETEDGKVNIDVVLKDETIKKYIFRTRIR